MLGMEVQRGHTASEMLGARPGSASPAPEPLGKEHVGAVPSPPLPLLPLSRQLLSLPSLHFILLRPKSQFGGGRVGMGWGGVANWL